MPIDREDIRKTAALARLQINDTEVTEVTGRIGAILDMVEQMQAVDTSDVTPMAHPLDAVQVLRADHVVAADDPIASRDQFQAIAPSSEQGLYLVPRVID